jgi:hypothetical protein
VKEPKMKTTLKMFAIATFVTASAASAFAANRHDRGYSEWQQFETYYASNGFSTGRDSMVQATGN